MLMDFNLNLTQEQKLIMTQQMQLSIKLLQMSTYDLREYIEIKFLNYIISYEHSLRCHAMNGSYFIEKEWF